MAQQATTPQGVAPTSMHMRGLLGSIVVSGVLPFIAYQFLTGRGVDSFHALLSTSVFPIIGVA